MPLHVAIVCPFILPSIDPRWYGPLGGAEKRLAGIARQIASRGHRVDIVCLDQGQGMPRRWEGGEIFPTFRETAGIRGVRFFYPRLASFLAALRRSNARILLLPSASGDAGVAALYARLSRRRIVLSISSDPNLDGRSAASLGWRDGTLYRLALRLSDKVVVQSVQQERRFKESFGDARLVRIPAGIAIPLAPRAGAGRYFLWAGSIRQVKRPDLFLDAAAAMPDHDFVMMGGPTHELELFERVECRARSLANVTFRGLVPQSEVQRGIAGAIALVNTSSDEGFPNTFLESWSAAVPVVSVGIDPDEILCKRTMGILTNDLQSLILALRHLASDPGGAELMGKNGRVYVQEHHAFPRITSAWEAMLSALQESDRGLAATHPDIHPS